MVIILHGDTVKWLHGYKLHGYKVTWLCYRVTRLHSNRVRRLQRYNNIMNLKIELLKYINFEIYVKLECVKLECIDLKCIKLECIDLKCVKLEWQNWV